MKEVAIVTGGGRGIGAATARLLAQRGYRVCVNWCRAAAPAEALVAEIEAAGGEAFAVQADIAKESGVLRLFQAVDDCGAPLKALVNNAGITGLAGRVESLTCDTLDEVLNTNVKGLILSAREAVKRMSTTHGGQGGAIVNLSSGAVSIGSPGEYVWYAASKGAVDSFTLGLAKEVAGDGIRVNAVAPGFVATEIHAASGLPHRLEENAPKVPMGRAADPAEVAEAILWLLSDAASYTTGAILRVAGGR
jgi:NAD(P)-dependent dehydrogenase (short-subunit alcohol dehydrogenase family)